MAKRLKAHVSVEDKNFRVHHFVPGDEPPGWARKLITNPFAWEDVPDAPAPRDTKPAATTVQTAGLVTGGPPVPDQPQQPGGQPPQGGPTPTPDTGGQSTGGENTGGQGTGGGDPENDGGTGGDGAGGGIGLPERPAGNANRESWAVYAEARGIEVTGQMGRDDLKAAVDALDVAEAAQ